MYIPEIPDNSLTKEITKVVELCQKLEPEYLNVTAKFNEPISEEELAKWENDNGIMIPESCKDWLRFSNGSDILNGLMVSYSLYDFIIECDDMSKDLVIIGNIIGNGEFICFSKETKKIILVDHGNLEKYSCLNDIIKRIIEMMQGRCGLSPSSISILKKWLKNQEKRTEKVTDDFNSLDIIALMIFSQKRYGVSIDNITALMYNYY